jgi:hypothetical protein
MRTMMKCIAAVLFALGLFTACESTEGGSTSVSAGMYYGTGFYDPWYYGPYYYWDDPDIIVTPPPHHPERPLEPTHPIATPPVAAPRPAPMPMPSIPAAPRPSFRR